MSGIWRRFVAGRAGFGQGRKTALIANEQSMADMQKLEYCPQVLGDVPRRVRSKAAPGIRIMNRPMVELLSRLWN